MSDFIKHQGEADPIVIIKCDQLVNMLVPSSQGSLKHCRQMTSSLQKINCHEQFSDSPAAIKKAVYALKTNGRRDVKKIIIFMTDGITEATGEGYYRASKAEKIENVLI